MSESRPDPDLRQEAHNLLHNQGLLALLETFGEPRPHGSYSLDVMAWRDLDICLITDDQSIAGFFALGAQLATLLRPVSMSFRNGLVTTGRGLPGLSWSIQTAGNPGWQIDIWAAPQVDFDRLTAYESDLQNRLTPELRATIRFLKAAFWQHPLYGRSFFARDIYEAAVFDEVEHADAFLGYLVDKGIHI